MNERFCDFVPYSIVTKVTNVTNVPYSIGTKKTSLELNWACDLTHVVHMYWIIKLENSGSYLIIVNK